MPFNVWVVALGIRAPIEVETAPFISQYFCCLCGDRQIDRMEVKGLGESYNRGIDIKRKFTCKKLEGSSV